MVAAGNGPSIANQRQLQYVTWKGKKWNEMDQLPRTEMQTNNLKWSVRGKINADAKKGNVEKSSKFTVFAANIVGSIRGNPFAEIQPRKSGHGNPTAEIHSRKSIRGNPGNQANLRKEDPLKSKQDRKRAQQLAISRLRSFCWLRWRVVETNFGGWSESEAQSARGHEPMNFFHEYGQ